MLAIVLAVQMLACPCQMAGPRDSCVVGASCGYCGAGTLTCPTLPQQGVCVYPTADLSVPAPASTGARTVFDPDSYAGTDNTRVQAALNAAAAVGGAVVMHRIFDISTGLLISGLGGGGLMITGGGLRRVCSPNLTLTASASSSDTCVSVSDATQYTVGYQVGVYPTAAYNAEQGSFTISSASGTQVCKSSALGFNASSGAVLGYKSNLIVTSPTDTSGIVIDSVLFDGANRCNAQTHDWRLNNTISLRGDNIIRNSVFYDSPSESITSCGGTFDSNFGWQLQGSLVHKSCGTSPEPLDTITNNYVDGANLATDAVMDHSEGVITLSANAGTITASGNIFMNGSEGVFGIASPAEENIHSTGDCYANFSRIILLCCGADPAQFSFGDTLTNAGGVQRQ